MHAVWYTAGLELRNRWRMVVALATLVGVGGALVLTLLAGARRADTSYARFRTVTRASDVSVAPGEFDAEVFDAIEHLPQVAASIRPVFPFVVPEGSGLYPFLEFNAVALPPQAGGSAVDAVRVVEGRLPHRARADEVAVIESFAQRSALSVGDRIRFESYAPEQFEGLFSTGDVGPPAGPRVAATITGIIDAPDFVGERDANFLPVVFFTAAFSERHAETIGMYPAGITLRLRNGQADVAEFTRSVRALLPDDDELEIQPATDLIGRIDDSLNVLVVGLLLCAACAALTALVAIAFAMSRHYSRAPEALRAMRSLGMTFRTRLVVSIVTMLPVAVAGALLAVVLAFLASPLMPVGIARDADPDLGFSFDTAALGTGFVVIVLAVVAVAGLVSWRVTAVILRRDERAGPSISRPLRRCAPIAAPVARSLGVRIALDPGHGRTALPVRTAALGTVLGIAGVSAAVVFAASLATTLDRPARYGFPWDAILAGFEGDRATRLVDDLRDDPRVADLGVLGTGIGVVGPRDVNVYAIQTVGGDPAPSMIKGRPVAGHDEVVLGAGTARELDVGVGDTVIVRGTDRRHRLRVTGIAALPQLDDRGSVDLGAIVTPRRLQSVAADGSINRDVLVRWAPGVDVASANRDLEDESGTELFRARVPSDVDNLQRVRVVPWALAALLAVVAILALAHAIVTTVSRRRRDFAVMRTLGFVDGQLSALVRWESSTFAAIGIVIGIPLGVAAGTLTWKRVADGIGIQSTTTTPPLLLALVALGTVVVALVTAAIPARRARRVPATTLTRLPA